MINRVILVGNLTKAPQYFKTNSGISYARFTVAVTKKYKDNEETSFISCIAWRQTADFLNQYANKGSKVALEGHITTGSYDDVKTGKKIYTTDVTADSVQLIGGKEQPKEIEQEEQYFDKGQPVNIIESDLPF